MSPNPRPGVMWAAYRSNPANCLSRFRRYPLRPNGRLNGLNRPTAFGATKSLRELRDVQPYRYSREPTHRAQPCHPTTRAMAFDVGEAIGGEFLDGVVQSVHVAPPPRWQPTAKDLLYYTVACAEEASP